MRFAEEEMNVSDLRNELHVTKSVLDVEGKKNKVTFMQLSTQLAEERKNSERQIAMISQIPPLPGSSSLSLSDVASKVEVWRRLRQELALANAKKTSIRDDCDELLVNNISLQILIKEHKAISESESELGSTNHPTIMYLGEAARYRTNSDPLKIDFLP